MVVMALERVERELAVLRDGGQQTKIVSQGDESFVLYQDVPTHGERFGLPQHVDVVVPVPSGYPGSVIDLAGLPYDSEFLKRVKGGQNIQRRILICGREWHLASYHPHNGGGGPPWDASSHGFHTYFEHLISWLAGI